MYRRDAVGSPEDTCVAYEEEDTCASYEEEDICVLARRRWFT